MNKIVKQNQKIDAINEHISELKDKIEELEQLADMLQTGIEEVELCPECSGFIVPDGNGAICEDCEQKFTIDYGSACGEIVLTAK